MISSEQRFGPFKLLVRLGHGGMGEVWKALGPGPSDPGEPLVVKRVLPHLLSDVEMARSFAREARLSENLRHPNIVQVYGSGQVDDVPYLSMEYLHGVDLHHLLWRVREGGLATPPAFAAYAAREVCRALAYAYASPGEDGTPRRLIHRDVSPTNVMITLDGEVKLLDFGIAKALAETTSERTRTGTLKGKFGYMAPETLDGAAANHLSDQFSVGVLLHEALTGQRLFRGESDVQTIARVKALQVPLPSAMGAGSEDALDRICLRALERDPTARFADCQEMARALGAVVERAGFGPGQAAAFLREVFPAGVERAPLALVPTEERQATVPRRSAGTTRKRGRVVFPVAATVVMLAAIGGAVWRARVAKDPVSVIIDAPAEGRLTQTPPPTMPFPELVLPARPNGTPPSRPEPPPTLSKLRTSHRTPVRARPLHAAATERTTAPLRPAAPPRPTRTERPAATEASQERKIRTGQVVDPFAR